MRILFSILMLSTVSAFSQTKTEILSEFANTAYFSADYSRRIDYEKSDTSCYVYISFQNAQYTAITDKASILLRAESGSLEVYNFLQDLKSAIKELEAGSEMTWNRDKYSISSLSKSISISTPTTEIHKYTFLKLKQAQAFADWLNDVWLKIQNFEG